MKTPRRNKKRAKSPSILQDTIAKTDNASTGTGGSEAPKKLYAEEDRNIHLSPIDETKNSSTKTTQISM